MSGWASVSGLDWGVELTDEGMVELAQDRNLMTVELHKVNDFYGNATVLKRYVGIEQEYPLKVMLEHGPNLYPYIWDVESNGRFYDFFCANRRYANAFQAAVGDRKLATPIGAYPFYLVEGDQLPRPERRTLVVFPFHSTHHFITSDDEENQFISELAMIDGRFDRVLVCVYWKDVLLGRHRKYIERGYSVTTAGHMYDSQFLLRVIDIISQASMVVSGNSGSEVVYSAMFGRPVYIFKGRRKLNVVTSEYASDRRDIDLLMYSEASYKPDLEAAFGVLRDTVPEESVALIDDVSGRFNRCTKDQLRKLFEEAEERYCAEKGVPCEGVPYCCS